MIKCSEKCPKGKDEGLCCISCSEHDTCDDVCEQAAEYEGCEYAVNEETALVDFEKAQLTVLEKISTIINMKKQCEEQEKQLKDEIKAAMEKYGIKKFESSVLNITYVAESEVTSIDSSKLKKLHPDIAAECSKTSKRSSYIKVEAKGK